MNQDSPLGDALPTTGRRPGCRRLVIALMLLACGGCSYRIHMFLSPGALEIGPETTVIEGPLLPDGRVDYVGALNERMSEGVSHETHLERYLALGSLQADVLAAPRVEISTSHLIIGALIGSRRVVSQQLADALSESLIAPYFQSVFAEARTEARLQLLRVALMLAAHRADHGSYPQALDQLAPEYFAKIPLDPFLDEPFRYTRTESGYRLYSVGDNMTDDGGLTYDSNPPGDDIIVETASAAADSATDQTEGS